MRVRKAAVFGPCSFERISARRRLGELVHLDVKKLGCIPVSGGKRLDEAFKETGSPC
ncbi:MAG: hypothetical protein R3B97_14900 [Dehalococcoidia bacterium]|nr:hypothetical protein [Dehalococcoidia bacterium]